MHRIHLSRPRLADRTGGLKHSPNAGSRIRRLPAMSLGDADAARAFYHDVLGGRQTWPARRADIGGGLWFLVSGTVIEVRSAPGSDTTPLMLEVDDPDALAQRCWDAGFTVRVHQDATGRAPVSVIDPFGRRIDLAPMEASTSPRLAAGEEER